ncbi:hypothetical protein GCM10010387_03390 [Streptomyces inusitatus]|uniref:Uncharacterized protein n=1 Tax=Streptomyces inusitatus TaxID=68221 RepID=A0A918PKU0_9ACTN|nr:ABC transporter substrate-binding protein [Streptomyces inusitatus]GGZ14582.1 hypothetical protein GCM10010387_03390 [Streptomyces inusitatus]
MDVVHVQTVNDFPYWKERGLLRPFRPEGLDRVDPDFVDPDGTYYALFVFAFSNVVDTTVIPEAGTETPRSSGVWHSARNPCGLCYTAAGEL